jgi:hypothetical protein
MKRSFCLSALLVGLSLTTATAAVAAPSPGTDTTAAKKVAQAQDPSTSATNGSASPSTGESTPQPAVSVGTSTGTPPGSDTPASSSASSNKAEPRRWAGTSVFLTQSMTTNTIFRGQTQYANPTTESNLWLLPRYAIDENWQLRARFIASLEETNSDGTTTRREPQLSDTTLQLFRRLPALPLDIDAKLAANLALPTSKGSQSRTMVVSPGATLQLSRVFENVLGGGVMLIGSLTYTHPFYRSKNPELTDNLPYAIACVGGNNCSDLVSGTMNTSDVFSYSLILAGEWGKWNPALFYLGASQWAYHPTDAKVPIAGGADVTAPPGFDPVTIRQTHYLSAWLDYNFNSWLTGEVGYWNSTSALDGQGQRANIVFNRLGGDTRVYLGASIQLDNLVRDIQGGSNGEAGVVRAKNNRKPPMFTF